jgi:pimeloyl-ACP methyl ester carboxylesterase
VPGVYDHRSTDATDDAPVDRRQTGGVADVTETRYARCGDAHIAYRVVGDGPVDMVLITDWFGHVEAAWENAGIAHFLERLGSFGRLITFDKRGVGLSDPVPLQSLPTLEDWMNDVGAVMDVVGSGQAALIASGSGGPMAMMFAATYPARVSALVLINSYARFARDDDYPWGVPNHLRDKLLASRVTDDRHRDVLAGSLADDPEFRAWWSRYLRLAASPGTEHVMRRWICEADVRSVLSAITAPTLVLQRADDRWILAGHGRYLRDHIAGARYVELPGYEDLYFAGDADGMLDEIEEFLTGARRAPDPDRVLATVFFADIVSSTERVVIMGDRKWRELLDRHDAAVLRQLDRHRGRAIDFAGDGVLATFDGPARAIQCATAIRDGARALGLDVRCGLHTGEIELRGSDVAGIAVHIGHRVSDLAQPGELLV